MRRALLVITLVLASLLGVASEAAAAGGVDNGATVYRDRYCLDSGGFIVCVDDHVTLSFVATSSGNGIAASTHHYCFITTDSSSGVRVSQMCGQEEFHFLYNAATGGGVNESQDSGFYSINGVTCTFSNIFNQINGRIAVSVHQLTCA